MFLSALPFAIAFLMVPLLVLGGAYGGLWVFGPFLYGSWIVSLLDRVLGRDEANMDPKTSDGALFWHRMVTYGWVPLHLFAFAFVYAAIGHGHLEDWEAAVLTAGLGLATGGIGITIAHELIHQRGWWERALGELLLVSNAYGHFATEHLRGHHVTVATPRDPVTARKGESYYRFFLRAVPGQLRSAWALDRARLARRGLPVWHRSNPFWRYGLGALAFAGLAVALAGPWGLAYFGLQCLIGIYQLEAVNYVEHYGLTREYLGEGRFERVKPRHSWNASQRVSNWLLINLQRHSDHHFRPDRRYPLLQSYPRQEAPQLPLGYPLMVFFALIPPLWFWRMDPKLDRWRRRFYPHITDWSAYEDGTIGQEAKA